MTILCGLGSPPRQTSAQHRNRDRARAQTTLASAFCRGVREDQSTHLRFHSSRNVSVTKLKFSRARGGTLSSAMMRISANLSLTFTLRSFVESVSVCFHAREFHRIARAEEA